MATSKRNRAKPKAKKKAKKSVKSRAATNRVRTKKPAAKPKARVTKRKAAPRAKPAAPKVPLPAAAPAATQPALVAGEERVGIVTHYYSHLLVAIVLMERGSLRIGDSVHIKGHTTDFQQRVESMEIDHVHVTQVGAKQEFGLRVIDHVREHDVVFKVAPH